jgi:hypothetical protein
MHYIAVAVRAPGPARHPHAARAGSAPHSARARARARAQGPSAAAAPKPSEGGVALTTLPAMDVYVLTYGGYSRGSAAKDKAAEAVEKLKAAGEKVGAGGEGGEGRRSRQPRQLCGVRAGVGGAGGRRPSTPAARHVRVGAFDSTHPPASRRAGEVSNKGLRGLRHLPRAAGPLPPRSTLAHSPPARPPGRREGALVRGRLRQPLHLREPVRGARPWASVGIGGLFGARARRTAPNGQCAPAPAPGHAPPPLLPSPPLPQGTTRCGSPPPRRAPPPPLPRPPPPRPRPPAGARRRARPCASAARRRRWARRV